MPMLLNRLKPHPLERLSSLLERLRWANYYEGAYWFAALLPSQLPQPLDYLCSQSHYAALAELTGLSVTELSQMTVHRLAAVVTPLSVAQHTVALEPDIMTLGLSAQESYIHGSDYTKMCPLCWKERHVTLLPWLIRHITTCHIHQILLVDACAICHQPLRIDRVRGCCRTCATALGDLPVISITEHPASLDLTNTLWSALLNEQGEFVPSDVSIAQDHPLRFMHPWTFLTFLWQGFQLLSMYDRDNPLFQGDLLPANRIWTRPLRGLRTATVEQMHGALVAMWRLLIHWPETWYSGLERIAKKQVDAFDMRPFPAALAERFQGPEWHWLHQAWAQFMQWEMRTNAAVVPWLRYYRAMYQRSHETPPLLSKREAARVLGVAEKRLQHLIDEGQVHPTATPPRFSQRPWQLLEAAGVYQLRSVRDQYFTLAQTAMYIGTSDEQIVALVRAGLLEAEHGPLVDGQSIWRFEPQSVTTCLEQLIGHLPVRAVSMADHTLVRYFPHIQRTVTGMRCRFPRLLEDLRDGTLPAARLTNQMSLTAIWCTAKDLVRYLATVRRRANMPLSVAAVCERLGCKAMTLKQLHASGLLLPIAQGDGGRCKYLEDDVHTFLERYITSDEAATLLGVTQVTAQNWARLGQIPVVIGPCIDGSHVYRFEKAVLRQWRYQRLTFGETVELLGVSKATLDRWAKQGKLLPLKDSDRKHRWFARKDVEELRKKLDEGRVE
jgi:predicted site-specific integrase-resolvase